MTPSAALVQNSFQLFYCCKAWKRIMCWWFHARNSTSGGKLWPCGQEIWLTPTHSQASGYLFNTCKNGQYYDLLLISHIACLYACIFLQIYDMLLFTVCLRIMWTFIKQCHQYPHLILCIFDLWPQKTWKHYIMTVIATLNWGHVLSSYDMLKVMKWMHLRGQWTAVSCQESDPRSLAAQTTELRPPSSQRCG